jgi:transcriptional regulator of acetoin/glycerol metabolism
MDRHTQVLEIWRNFIISGEIIDDNRILPQAIIDSWKKCRACGIDPYQKRSPVVLKGGHLSDLLKKNRELIDVSRPFLENLYTFFKGSGFIASLADADGYILDLMGDQDVMDMTRQSNFVIGALWSEEIAGTNMISLTLSPFKTGSDSLFGTFYCRYAHV